MVGDLSVVGFSVEKKRRKAVSGTRTYHGEPLHRTDTTLSSGVATNNVWIPAAADTPIIGTHIFGGIQIKNDLVNGAGTVIAQTVIAVTPIPGVGLIRGRAETVASVDTDAELLLIINDAVLIDYAATGSSSSGPLYTIKEVASADTSGLTIIDGNPAKSTLDVEVDVRCFRIDIT